MLINANLKNHEIVLSPNTSSITGLWRDENAAQGSVRQRGMVWVLKDLSARGPGFDSRVRLPFFMYKFQMR